MKRILMFASCMLLGMLILQPVQAVVSENTQSGRITEAGSTANPYDALCVWGWSGNQYNYPKPSCGTVEYDFNPYQLKDTLVFDFYWRGVGDSLSAQKDFNLNMYLNPGGPMLNNYITETMNFGNGTDWYHFEYPVPYEAVNYSGEDMANLWTSSTMKDSYWAYDQTECYVHTIDKGRYDNSADQPVPEPGTWMMMGTGLIGMISYEVRRRKAKKL